MTFQSAVETLYSQLPELRKQSDVVVVSYHGGFERDLETDEPTEALTGENEASDLLETLQDAATRLRSRRMAKGNTLILQSETGSDQIIEEAMIHAKHCIADFATKASGR